MAVLHLKISVTVTAWFVFFQLLSEPQLEDISSYGYINDVYFPVITEIQLQSHVQSVSAMERVLNGVDETAI